MEMRRQTFNCLNSSQVTNKNFLNHSSLNVFLKMETMQKVNNFSEPSTTYKISITQLFSRALSSVFRNFNFLNFPVVPLIIRTYDYRSLDSFSCSCITILDQSTQASYTLFQTCSVNITVTLFTLEGSLLLVFLL